LTSAPTSSTGHDRAAAVGALLCLLSAAGFGAMAIFGKLAYDAGVGVLTLLLVRFVLGGLIFGALIGIRPGLRARRAGRRAVLFGLGLGAIGYATQAGLFFGALERLDASLLALLLYTYPAFVTVAAIGLGRETPSRRRIGALLVSSSGVALVLAGAAGGGFDALGAAMGLGAALPYTAYILVCDTVELEALPLSALVTTGAALTFGVVAAASGSWDTGFAAEGWLWIGLIAAVSTVSAIVLFFAGLQRVGPSMTAILSTLEPPVTVGLAFLVFGETLTAVQIAGGLLVLGAIVALNVARPPVPVTAGP
jgi:drug/metabolite transporter (DMT)-like permease